jgi:hypothetical protein
MVFNGFWAKSLFPEGKNLEPPLPRLFLGKGKREGLMNPVARASCPCLDGLEARPTGLWA